LSAAEGEFVTFINQDDKYASPRAISSLVQEFLDNPRWDAVHGEVLYIDSEGRPDPLAGPRSAPMWLFRYTRIISHGSVLVRRKYLTEKNLFFDESLSYAPDYDWFNRLMQVGCRFRRIRKPIMTFLWHQAVTLDHLDWNELRDSARAAKSWFEKNYYLQKGPDYLLNFLLNEAENTSKAGLSAAAI